jgi:DNA-binding HxlR family transcriptional regulator
MMNNAAIGLLLDDATRQLFERVARLRMVRLRELVSPEAGIDQNTALRKLGELEKMGLIDEKRSPVPELTTYFVTADGLDMERKLRR